MGRRKDEYASGFFPRGCKAESPQQQIVTLHNHTADPPRGGLEYTFLIWIHYLWGMEENKLRIGLKGRREERVTEEMTAAKCCSGPVRVYATPMMIALMETTCWRLAQSCLPEGQDTVGTKVLVNHLASTPAGMKVWCECEIIGIDRRAITFSVKAYDEAELIGEGTHERFIIDLEKFQAKTDAKLSR